MPPKKQSVYFVSLGCPKNRVDTEVMLGLTDHAGLSIVNAPERADVVYQGGTFPSPLVEQSSTSLPPPRATRAGFGA